MLFYIKTVYYDDGDIVEVALTFPTMDAALDWIRLVGMKGGKVRYWYRFTMSVLKTSEHGNGYPTTAI